MGYSIYKINFDTQTHTVLYDCVETIEEADLLAQLAMSNKYYTNNRALKLAEEYKCDRK